MGPETSMEIQANLGSDIALVFDECTPFHVDREYTARSTERTHRWLDRCLDWHDEHGPARPARLRDRPGRRPRGPARRERASGSPPARCAGIAIGGSLGAEKPQMYEVVGWTTAALPEDRPRHLLGIGEIDDLVAGVELGIDTFDCAMPTRLGRHGMALVPDPERRWRVDLTKSASRDSHEPLMEGCPCPACAIGYTRGYLHYMCRNKELTAMRLADAPQPRVRGAGRQAPAGGRGGGRPRGRRGGPPGGAAPDIAVCGGFWCFRAMTPDSGVTFPALSFL